MTMDVKTIAIGKQPNKAEQAFIEAFPVMMLDQFRKLMSMITATGLIDLKQAIADGKGVPFDPSIVAVAIYIGALRCMSLDGVVPAPAAKTVLDAQLLDIIKKSVITEQGSELEAIMQKMAAGADVNKEGELSTDNVVPFNTTKH